MQERVKLTKRQMKEDKFTAFMLTSKQQFEDNWQYIAIGVVVTVLAVAGILYYLNSAKESAALAAGQLSQANLQYRQGNNQVAILTLTDILAKYPNTESAEHATFMLGKVNLESRNYEEAKMYFNQYLDKYKENVLNRAAATSGLAVSLENQANYAEAAATFEKGTVEFAGNPLEAELHLGAMRNYLLAGQVDQARVHLDFINKNYGDTDFGVRAARLFYEKSSTS
jgi:predicted negative regulator of RcsB-dependent stress response